MCWVHGSRAGCVAAQQPPQGPRTASNHMANTLPSNGTCGHAQMGQQMLGEQFARLRFRVTTAPKPLRVRCCPSLYWLSHCWEALPPISPSLAGAQACGSRMASVNGWMALWLVPYPG
jgi:hypothetical protein